VAVYDLERLVMVLVEDNSYIRHTLEDVLRHFGIRRITIANNGAEAIDHLKSVTSSPNPQSVMPDIILADLVMSPVNGLLVLRWLRTSKESPNRFMPFIMISGAADRDYVNAARDLGVNEFLAKPFSATVVYKHLLEIIDYPRQFVATQSYFGPDRRRRNVGISGSDRRMKREEDVTIVYSVGKVVKPKTTTDVWYFRLPNALKEKVAGLGAEGPGELPTALLEEAEAELERSALDFTEWALGYLAKLSALCDDALTNPSRRPKYFVEINLLAHELRGQGGTFGYPLVSIFGKMLYDATGEGCRKDDTTVEIVKHHIDAMRAVLRDKIAGDGGTIGRDLIESLKAAIVRLTTVT
jgi:CheY-like chemotaxis protein